MRAVLPIAILLFLSGCAGAVRGGGDRRSAQRYTAAGASDEPSQERVVLADGRVEYELTAWHLSSGTHVDATIRNHGPGVLAVDPSRAVLATGDDVPVAAMPGGCGVCPGGGTCPEVPRLAPREIPAGGSGRVLRCFAPVNPWAGRHDVSGADPTRLALKWRDEGLVLDGTPLVVELRLTRR